MVLPMGCSGERIEGTKQVLSKEGKDQRSRAFPAMDLTCKTLSELVCTCISVSGLELVCPSFFAHPDLCFLPFLHLDLVRIEVETPNGSLDEIPPPLEARAPLCRSRHSSKKPANPHTNENHRHWQLRPRSAESDKKLNYIEFTLCS